MPTKNRETAGKKMKTLAPRAVKPKKAGKVKGGVDAAAVHTRELTVTKHQD